MAAELRLPDVVAKLYELLEPLDKSTRGKAIRSVLALFDDDVSSVSVGISDSAPVTNSRFPLGKRAHAWAKRNSVTDEMLEQCFHFESGNVEMLTSPPGANKREQTINAYLLVGLEAFLATDDPRFADGAAVAACRKHGCYDAGNHAQTRSLFGNRVSGSKESGFILTTPGLDQAAALVKSIAMTNQ
jgi:hypothetical protein